MNKQEVFNTVKTHLLKQGIQCMKNGICAYRSEDGQMKCAIGALIKDEYYSESLENKIIIDEPVKQAVENSLGTILLEEEVCFLRELQDIHDTFAPKNWAMYLETFAFEHGLKY